MKIITEKYDRYGNVSETTISRVVSDDEADCVEASLSIRPTHCNVCGRELTSFDKYADIALTQLVGYGSRHDGELVHIRFCCDCFDALADGCKIDPVVRPDEGMGGAA